MYLEREVLSESALHHGKGTQTQIGASRRNEPEEPCSMREATYNAFYSVAASPRPVSIVGWPFLLRRSKAAAPRPRTAMVPGSGTKLPDMAD